MASQWARFAIVAIDEASTNYFGGGRGGEGGRGGNPLIYYDKAAVHMHSVARRAQNLAASTVNAPDAGCGSSQAAASVEGTDSYGTVFANLARAVTESVAKRTAATPQLPIKVPELKEDTYAATMRVHQVWFPWHAL